MKKSIVVFLSLTLFISFTFKQSFATNAKFSVFVVMSYEAPEKNPWCKEIQQGIESVLGETCKLDYFYLDTKINFKGGVEKAKEAYGLFTKKKYDGVIAADDNAQQMFVMPFLKSKVDTPVMFCGVNADPKKYGYPTENISGILERGHFSESVAFVKQLVPTIDNIGFIAKNSPSGIALKGQIELESENFLAKVLTFELIDSLGDIAKRSRLNKCDAFFIDSLEGLSDGTGNTIGNKEVIEFLHQTYGLPIVGANNIHVQLGALCAVVKSGVEQGKESAKKLLSAMKGKPVSQIPVTKNYRGVRVINIETMHALDISPKPVHLLGAELIKSVNGK